MEGLPDGKIMTKPKEVVENAFRWSDKEETECYAQKEVVRNYRAELKKEMLIKKPHADIARAIQLLRPFYRSLNHIDQRRFANYLQNEMSKKVKK